MSACPFEMAKKLRLKWFSAVSQLCGINKTNEHEQSGVRRLREWARLRGQHLIESTGSGEKIKCRGSSCILSFSRRRHVHVAMAALRGVYVLRWRRSHFGKCVVKTHAKTNCVIVAIIALAAARCCCRCCCLWYCWFGVYSCAKQRSVASPKSKKRTKNKSAKLPNQHKGVRRGVRVGGLACYCMQH